MSFKKMSSGICRLLLGKTDLQHHELHEDELGYAGCLGDRLTYCFISSMKMSWGYAICKLTWRMIDLQYNELHEDEL
jgi:hypothetical protein